MAATLRRAATARGRTETRDTDVQLGLNGDIYIDGRPPPSGGRLQPARRRRAGLARIAAHRPRNDTRGRLAGQAAQRRRHQRLAGTARPAPAVAAGAGCPVSGVGQLGRRRPGQHRLGWRRRQRRRGDGRARRGAGGDRGGDDGQPGVQRRRPLRRPGADVAVAARPPQTGRRRRAGDRARRSVAGRHRRRRRGKGDGRRGLRHPHPRSPPARSALGPDVQARRRFDDVRARAATPAPGSCRTCSSACSCGRGWGCCSPPAWAARATNTARRSAGTRSAWKRSRCPSRSARCSSADTSTSARPRSRRPPTGSGRVEWGNAIGAGLLGELQVTSRMALTLRAGANEAFFANSGTTSPAATVTAGLALYCRSAPQGGVRLLFFSGSRTVALRAS